MHQPLQRPQQQPSRDYTRRRAAVDFERLEDYVMLFFEIGKPKQQGCEWRVVQGDTDAVALGLDPAQG